MSSTSTPADALTLELQRIRGLIEARQLREAADGLNVLQPQAPRDPRLPLLGMRLAEHAGNAAGAIHAARRALALAPDWHVAQVELAKLLAYQPEHADEAMNLATQALASQPRNIQVMVGAINVALAAGRGEQCRAWAEEGVRRFPDDAGIQLFLARLLDSQGEPAEAVARYEAILARAPNLDNALLGLTYSALKAGDGVRAQMAADRLLALKPDDEQVRYWHALAHGQTPATQPAKTVANLFDGYADRFDMHLVRGLQYQVPRLVAEKLRALHPTLQFNLLDLGCGTGLVAVYLGRIQGHMIGVDLSEKMIEQAARHNLYSRFHHVNVLDALRETPADHYEAITCTDVLVYVGDLAPVIPNALRILKPGGHFIFSCETAAEDEAEVVLRPSGRYAHQASAVERQCREAGFDDVQIEHLPTLRTEGGQPLPGFLVTAHKPLATA